MEKLPSKIFLVNFKIKLYERQLLLLLLLLLQISFIYLIESMHSKFILRQTIFILIFPKIHLIATQTFRLFH